MLPGRCVVLGCQRRLSPHSTASSHLAFGGIVATNRTSHWDPCCYGPAHVFGSGSLAALATGPSTLMPTAGTSLSPGVEVNSLGAATSLCGPFRAASTIISSSCRATSTSCGNRWPGNVRVRACCCGTVRSVLTNADESPPTCSSSSSSGARSKEKCNGDSVSVSSSSSNSTGNGSSGSCCSGSSIDSNGSRANGRKTGDTTAATATVMRGASGSCTRELVEDTTPENWLTPFVRPGSVVALGKFDALHKGHRALAATAAALAREIHASSSTCDTDTNHQLEAAGTCGVGTTADVGDAILLSFSGMATVLGWPDRLPLTAPQDRGRVLWGWAAACSAGAGTDTNSNDGRGSDAEVLVELAPPPPESSSTSSGAERRMAGARLGGPAGAVLSPRLRTLPFSLIRGMSPEQFVALLAHDLGAAGVVAGRNYRFGYKAAGDADTLLRLGQQYGMRVAIVDLVTLPDPPTATSTANSQGNGSNGHSTDADAASRGTRDDSNDDSSSGSSSDVTGSCVTKTPSDPNQQTASETAGRIVSRKPDVDPEYRACVPSNSRCGDGSGGSGGGSAVGTSSRVSSSRIRELLERGQAESVEQLLGRKYRLVCDLKIAATITRHNSNSTNNSMISAGRAHGSNRDDASSRRARCESQRLMVPYAAYQNQPPANGHYRALVQLVRGSEIPVEVDLGVEGGEASFRAVDGVRESISAANQTSGGVCMMVELSDWGIEVELTQPGIEHVINGCDEGLLLVDFDACG